jgi:hypothetical protein
MHLGSSGDDSGDLSPSSVRRFGLDCVMFSCCGYSFGIVCFYLAMAVDLYLLFIAVVI